MENNILQSLENEETKRNNFLALSSHLALAIVISAAYFAEFIKGDRALGYALLTAALGLIFPIIEIIIYQRNKSSKSLKHVIGIGFGIFYMFTSFTTVNKLAFTFVLPMLIALVVYGDYKYCLRLSIGTVVINIAQVIILFTRGVYTSADTATIEIQILLIIVIGFFEAMGTRSLQKNNQDKLNIMMEQNSSTSGALAQMKSVSEEIGAVVEKVTEDVKELKQSVEITKDAMKEVDIGSADTAETIQNQLEMTEQIRITVEEVEERTDEIVNSLSEANESVKQGGKNIAELVEKVDESVHLGNDVKDRLEELCESMEKMHSVIEIINGITSQTSLLALNASIEAARAGEAGRGFAVVASEISKMAGETEAATNEIKQMLQDFADTINGVVDVTGGIIEKIESQHQATESTEQVFKDISVATNGILEVASTLQRCVDELSKNNHEIADSVATVSAISEEVTSHASNTLDISEKNIIAVDSVADATVQLNELAEKLKSN